MHVHRWLIEEPKGRRRSPGKCECGETRMFVNYFEEMSWKESMPRPKGGKYEGDNRSLSPMPWEYNRQGGI